MTSTIPSALGNRGPTYRATVVLRPGPRRYVEDGDGLRHHIPQGGFPRRRRSRVKLEACRNILVVKLDFIGDWVLTTPFLENVRLNAPKAKITAVVLDRAFDLASACPFVDRVISVSDAVGRRTIFGAASVGALAGFRRDIEDGAFDLALVPRWDVDFNGAILVAHGSRAKRIAGFTEASTKRKAMVNRGDDRFYTDLVADPRSVHEVEHKLALVEAVGGRVLSRRASAHFTEADGAHARAFLSDRFGGGPLPVLAVAPFVADPKRVFPLPRLAAIVDALAARHGFRIVVLGSPWHRAEAESFAGRLAAPAASAAGLMRTRETAALTAFSAVFLGMDSGPGHIAAAVGTPTAVISCHPKTGHPDHVNSPVRFAPWGEAGRVLVIQPERAVDPCCEGCQAGEAHCIASLSDDRLIADISAFFSRFVPPLQAGGRQR